MQEFLILISDYLKGKSIYAPIRRALSLLFSISIASFIYEKIYGKYDWLSITEYKEILNFFVKGTFFIPFSIFLLSTVFTQAISSILFLTISHFQTTKWEKAIIDYQIKKDGINNELEKLVEVSGRMTPITYSYPMLLELANKIKEKLTEDVFEKMTKVLETRKQELESNFHTCTKLIIAISIYYSSLPQFGGLLYIIILIVVLATMFLIWIAHCILGVFPTIARKFHKVLEQITLDQSKMNN